MMIKLSVVIPSYKDPYLVKTIDSLLVNSGLGKKLEIIAVLDGYWPTFEIINDPRVRYVHLGKNRGMKGAINAGVAISQGEFIMRTDEHCAFGKDYDRILTETCEPNWIVTARRYFLDPDKWEVMDIPYIDYERLVTQTIGDAKKFTGFPWVERANKRKNIMIDETMAMQGSMWVMARSWWDKVIGELEAGPYGTHYQDQHEMIFKTWKAGGKMMVNKNTWFAHRHNSFRRHHQVSHGSQQKELQAFYDYWKDYYMEIKKQWNV
jgi:glycosyltransferase involved in cell wall biosynthesis